MTRRPLDNYLRTHRKRAGLSQEEASQLVGLRNRIQFARYERYQAEPPLRVAFACEHVFGVPMAQLFAGLNTAVARQTRKRVQLFERRLHVTRALETSRQLQYKLQWISQRLRQVGNSNFIS